MLIKCSVCGKFYDPLNDHRCNTQEIFRVPTLSPSNFDYTPKTCTCGTPSFMDRIFGRPGFINSQCPVHGTRGKGF